MCIVIIFPKCQKFLLKRAVGKCLLSTDTSSKQITVWYVLCISICSLEIAYCNIASSRLFQRKSSKELQSEKRDALLVQKLMSTKSKNHEKCANSSSCTINRNKQEVVHKFDHYVNRQGTSQYVCIKFQGNSY